MVKTGASRLGLPQFVSFEALARLVVIHSDRICVRDYCRSAIRCKSRRILILKAGKLSAYLLDAIDQLFGVVFQFDLWDPGYHSLAILKNLFHQMQKAVEISFLP